MEEGEGPVLPVFYCLFSNVACCNNIIPPHNWGRATTVPHGYSKHCKHMSANSETVLDGCIISTLPGLSLLAFLPSFGSSGV